MDWDDFERRASLVIPKQPLKPKRCWIGVLFDDKDPCQHVTEFDFIWMIGHSKITIEKIWETYQARQSLSDFHIVTRNGVLDKKLILKDIIDAGSELVVFRAVRAARLSHEIGVDRAPLTPLPTTNGTSNSVNAQRLPSPSSSFTGCTKKVPRHVTVSQLNAGPATPLVLPSVHVQRTIGPSPLHPSPQMAPSASPWFAGHMQHHGQVLPPGQPLPISYSSAHVSSTYPASSPAAARANNGGIGQSTAASPTIKREASIISPGVSVSQAPVFFPSQRQAFVQSPQQAFVPSPQQAFVPSPQQAFIPPPHQVYSFTPFAAAQQLDVASTFGVPQLYPEPEHQPPQDFRNDVEKQSSQPFDAGHFFMREPSPEQDTQDETRPADEFIREIIKQESPEVLEAGVQQSLKVLQDFKKLFTSHAASVSDAQAWEQSIDKLIPLAKRKRTVVGVVGNTGAGKSSVINAMLDEERLVPTNCMRACTAVVTEMSWNDSTDPCSKYRAEIEFVSRADWQKEVAMLMKEFLTENGTLQREASDQNTEAGIAWAKFHSVHPRIARDELGECTVEMLMSDKGLDVLGTTKKISSSEPHRFYQELQRYVDSKEKITKKDKSSNPAFAMEYWPLIKVVKIYAKAPALSTGAVIVDLPGVHDSNAARAAVAQGYIKQCTGLWIVAPITRAVDDKAAKTLLGDSFKMQLKYDGGFSTVTFICSKTDDISITEAVDTLQLEGETEELYAEEAELKRSIKKTQAKLEDLKESQHVYLLAGRETAEEIETWEELKDKLDDGERVYTPAPKSVKRKKGPSAKKTRKKRQAEDAGSDAEFVVIDDEDESETDDEDDDEEVQVPQEPLTEEDIKAKLKELREAKKQARRRSTEIKHQIEELRPTVREAQTKIKDIKAKISRICISGRNEYSKEAIQNDFAAGIKELDQENAAEEDEDNFNPDEEQRDYDQVARSLPVFCVSSRAYQRICGRLLKDDPVPGFETVEETQIPQLQAHCKKLTEAGRVQGCRNFLLSVCQLLTTSTLWASNDGTGLKMTDDDKRKQGKYVERRLKELEDGLVACVKACLNAMKREMNDQIFDKYPDLIQDAIAAAPSTANGWGAHRNDGGLYWATYKAVVRREGVYHSSSAGHRDFNLELVDPIIKKLATGWERAFQNRLPKAFSTFITDSGKVLHKFHEAVEARARDNGVGLASLSTLKTQIHTYEMLFGELNQILIEQMNDLQREANRTFTPTIASIMDHVYKVCTAECGSGSFKRMKGAMTDHVERNRHHMFNAATLTVKRGLDVMCRRLEELMETRADEIFVKMRDDYMRVLIGVQVPRSGMSREESGLRRDVIGRLRGLDAEFEAILKGESGLGDGVAGNEEADEEIVNGQSAHGAHDSMPAVTNADNANDADAIMQDATTRDNANTDENENPPARSASSPLPLSTGTPEPPPEE